jgi:ferredoxin
LGLIIKNELPLNYPLTASKFLSTKVIYSTGSSIYYKKYHTYNFKSDIMEVSIEKCGYCGACVGVCNRLAIELIENTIIIDNEKCNNCGLCAIVCPLNALNNLEE